MSAIQRVKIRGFEVAAGWQDKEVKLPARATTIAAGYDFFAPEDLVVPATGLTEKPKLLPTGIKAYMRHGEFLMLANRSSHPKKGLLLANGLGVVDADYYENEDNDGHIMFAYWNVSTMPVFIKRGDKIGQGVFMPYLIADHSESPVRRRGGFGSTDPSYI